MYHAIRQWKHCKAFDKNDKYEYMPLLVYSQKHKGEFLFFVKEWS